MVEKTIENPFDELSEALVEEMLNQCDELEKNLSNSFQKLCDNKNEIKQELKRKKLLRKETEISFASAYPTIWGVPGSYAIKKLLSRDMVFIARLALEGLMPLSEKRHWHKPHHYLPAIRKANYIRNGFKIGRYIGR